ncbi:hypothetical protein BDW62DRAFT_141152 [Aspergillus aurantiobrunneus]
MRAIIACLFRFVPFLAFPPTFTPWLPVNRDVDVEKSIFHDYTWITNRTGSIQSCRSPHRQGFHGANFYPSMNPFSKNHWFQYSRR